MKAWHKRVARKKKHLDRVSLNLSLEYYLMTKRCKGCDLTILFCECKPHHMCTNCWECSAISKCDCKVKCHHN